ncbi:hypothetical protein RSal33209_0069 [Renibacterium salmoninarum ATCC 33209]|uniref:Uncharacterized protein n=1 Tax=Renibacterium salmoninarum (strain ATCC 33209 / DSM 20767 / JCM 11484 / NBRC 15589 / NCIMB 2235) TaxID=288705 RepID=A9WLP5_RENSM|nr:hypothetical protein RSal33209_0069 [Renibacterium salmoninarum ATCC 33209]
MATGTDVRPARNEQGAEGNNAAAQEPEGAGLGISGSSRHSLGNQN